MLVVIDTLRQDHLRAYGYHRETGPVLTRLADEGAVLDALTPAPWTKPAMASVFTGLHPLRHQAVGLRDSLPQAARSLAEALRERGYDTLGVTANAFSSGRFGMDQGFRESLYLGDAGHSPFASAEEVNAEVLKRLDSLRPPFFLFVHYLDPHAPYEAPGWGVVRPGRSGRPVSIQDLDAETFRRRPPELLQRALDNYDGEIVRASAALGRLLERLAGAAPLTVVTSDHGEEFEEHGRMGHGQTLYDEVLRVPLIVHWPGRVPPGRRAGIVSLLDLAPTLMDLAGAPFDAAALDGVSLAWLLRAAAATTTERDFLLHVDVTRSHYLGLRRGPRKLIVGRYPHLKQLFDARDDPAERHDLLRAGSPPAGFEELARALADAHGAAQARALARADGADDVATRGSLAALGYVGSGSPEGERRGIPARVRAPDPDPHGRLGWEDPGRFESCLDLLAPGAADQLLRGWHAAGADGRWTGPEAELLLKRPRLGPWRLSLAGRRPETGPARLRVRLEGRDVLDTEVGAGAFEVVAPVDGSALPGDGPLRLGLSRDAVYVPAQQGPAPAVGQPPDHRRLGFLLTRVCLAPAPR
jgi:arylsulfatase A-like enzyme